VGPAYRLRLCPLPRLRWRDAVGRSGDEMTRQGARPPKPGRLHTNPVTPGSTRGPAFSGGAEGSGIPDQVRDDEGRAGLLSRLGAFA
jgi:hypothetical protein